MKRHEPTPELERWLAAEAADDGPAAEAALAVLMRELPEVEVPAGFADAVLRRVSPAAAQPMSLPAESGLDRWLRWAVLAAAACGFLGAILWVVKPLADPLLLALGWDELAPESLPGLAAALVSLASRLLAALLGGLQEAQELSAVVARALQNPALALTVAASVLLGALALLVLARLLRPELLRSERGLRHALA